jgi:hypothetical protein
MKSAEDNKKLFSMAPASGCISYTNYEKIWRNAYANDGDFPLTAEQADQKAWKFFANANSLLSQNNLSHIFPLKTKYVQMRHLETYPVTNPDTNLVDHWLCQFIVYLLLGPNNDYIPVYNGTIETRIGSGSDPSDYVIGLRSFWRPCYPLPKSVQTRSFADINDNNIKSTYQYYLMSGQDEPQSYISPYFSFSDDTINTVLPLCSYSLILGIAEETVIAQDQATSASRLTAIIIDENGLMNPFEAKSRMKYFWSCWRIDRGTEIEFEDLGTTSSVELTGGVYNVVLVVEDRHTGVVLKTQKMAYIGLDIEGDVVNQTGNVS